MRKFICTICGYIYDEEKGIPEKGIAPGTKWDDLPSDWQCPLCGAPKNMFKEMKDEEKIIEPINNEENVEDEVLREVSFGELSAICTNLSKGCEKQYLDNESKLFKELADYFIKKNKIDENKTYDDLLLKINNDLEKEYPLSKQMCNENMDRASLRALTWSEKSTLILKSLIERVKNEGSSFLENTNVYVCDICGFIYIGNEPPAICPICKVPNKKILQIKGV